MANRKRNIQVKFYVTAEEKELMEQKMAQLQTKRIGAYLRKMAIDGYIIQVDTTDIKEMTRALSAIGRNINQIAKRLNEGKPANIKTEQMEKLATYIYRHTDKVAAVQDASLSRWGIQVKGAGDGEA